MNERFEISPRLRNTSLALIAVGIIALVAGLFNLKFSHDHIDQTRFWIVLLHNSVFFAMVTVASIFILEMSQLTRELTIPT